MIASDRTGMAVQGAADACPVRSLYILKNGLPVFTRDLVPSPSTSGEGNQTLVSGFLTALTAFLHDMKDFGEMRTLVTSSNVRFTFYQVESLLFVICTDGNMEETLVERFLRNISARFLQVYGDHILHTNMINMRHYEGFEAIVQRELLSKELRQEHSGTPKEKGLVPRLLMPADDIRCVFNFTEEMHEKVVKYIDGKTSADEIAKLSGMESARVASILRYMCKQGIVSF
ncbi:MAG: hypothetical protein Q6373_008980 [Candidatus Sigynarchaeota archaeon]